jgi:P4 family phage/plasmid primase-like protien
MSNTDPIKFDSDAAVHFLTSLRDDVSISRMKTDPDTGKVSAGFPTLYFKNAGTDLTQGRALLAHIESLQNTNNAYYSVNSHINPENKKASIENIKSVDFFHVDLDPLPGEDQDVAIPRLIKKLKAYRLPPTWIICSGGCVQALWKLQNPIPINGDRALAEEAKRYNQQLERDLGGDNCHNIDRVLRVPGTVNIPNKTKRNKGRRAATTYVHRHMNVEYDVNDLKKANKVQDASERAESLGGSGVNRIKVNVPSTVARVLDLFTHPETKGIKDSIKQVLMHGYDPKGETGKWPSRSEAVFACVREMERCKVPDEVIYAIITDPDYKISESILEKPDVEREATRVIARARVRESCEKPRVQERGKATRVLEKNAWSNIAKIFVEETRPNLRHHNDEFFDWANSIYKLVPESTMKSEARLFLDASLVRIHTKAGFKSVPFNPSNHDGRELVGALEDHRHLPHDDVSLNSWLPSHDGPAPSPEDCINFPNGILHVPTGQFLEPTPNFFSRNVTGFPYVLDAPKPDLWEQTLKQYWPKDEDQDNIDTLQEWFGYCLTPSTKHHKMLALTGPLRAGKGVISRIGAKLVGKSNAVATSLDAFGSQHGMVPLVGKTYGVVAEAIVGYKADAPAMVRNLLSVSGGDAVQIERKYLAAWEGTLSVRLMWLCNMLPKFPDAGGALTNRIIILPMLVSFLGRENPDLEAELERELPGILLWAMDGLKRLNARGKFIQPKGGEQSKTDMAEIAAPERAFVAECCVLGSNAVASKDELFGAWRLYCTRNGNNFPGTKDVFLRNLTAAFLGQFRIVRPTGAGGASSSPALSRHRPRGRYRRRAGRCRSSRSEGHSILKQIVHSVSDVPWSARGWTDVGPFAFSPPSAQFVGPPSPPSPPSFATGYGFGSAMVHPRSTLGPPSVHPRSTLGPPSVQRRSPVANARKD